LGGTIGMVITGLATRFDEVLSASGNACGIVLFAAFVALAIGLRVPQRFAMWLCAIAWQRFLAKGSAGQLSTLAISPGGADRPLYWVALSVIALLSGIATALMPLNVRVVFSVHAWMQAHFLWSVGPLTVLNLTTVFAAVLIPLALLGLAVSCTHHLACRYGQWDPRATAWLLIGAAGGVYLAGQVTKFTGKADLVLLASGIPVLLVALLSAGFTRTKGTKSEGDRGADSSSLPLWEDLWPTFLRATIAATAVAGVCAVWVWNGHFEDRALPAEKFIAFLLLSSGIGVWAGSRSKRVGFRSIGGFGVSCATAGVISSGASIWVGGGLSVNVAGVLGLACISLAAIAFAFAYGHQTLLNRVAGRSSVGATIFWRVLVGGGLTVWFVAPISVHLLGEVGTLAMLGLALLAVGGVLIILEPEYSPRTRRARLWAIFSAIGTAILLSAFSFEGGNGALGLFSSRPNLPTPSVESG
jgi:hypothetical protein